MCTEAILNEMDLRHYLDVYALRLKQWFLMEHPEGMPKYYLLTLGCRKSNAHLFD